jgi:hypothetical protein
MGFRGYKTSENSRALRKLREGRVNSKYPDN